MIHFGLYRYAFFGNYMWAFLVHAETQRPDIYSYEYIKILKEMYTVLYMYKAKPTLKQNNKFGLFTKQRDRVIQSTPLFVYLMKSRNLLDSSILGCYK
jgi:hypothetical protein